MGDPPVTVTLLDTPGYGEAGASADQLKQIRTALQESNAVLVVMDAHSPAREADRRTTPRAGRVVPLAAAAQAPADARHPDARRPAATRARMVPAVQLARANPAQRSKASTKRSATSTSSSRAAWSAWSPSVPTQPGSGRGASSRRLIPALTGILNDAQSAALLQTFERNLNRDQLKRSSSKSAAWGAARLCLIEERLQPAQTQKSAD